ncbi:MAG TPA: Gfo/Idh/MocA family oxidoreductase, partial [Spirochaetia bacterium]|nr:Gfo/Idh/MocA family oxidoreductase [Spirochaetia bacterium]
MIKVGLIGAGYIGPIHLEALTRIGGIKVDTVIDANRQIDVIHNCTPNKFHYEINKKALQAGKHILSEKPLAMSTQEAEELVELALRVRRGDAGTIRMVTGSYFQDWLSRETDWTWRLLRSESGKSNIAADLGSHWFDLIQFTTGLRVREVMGDLATLIPVCRRPRRQVLAFEKADQGDTEAVNVELEEYA